MATYQMITDAPRGQQAAELVDALAEAWIATVIDRGKYAVYVFTPRDKGHLEAWLRQHSKQGRGRAAWGGVGPLDGLDIDVSVRGLGYLKRFLIDNQLGFVRYWMHLSREEKALLQAGREAGNTAWGGKVINQMYAPRYMMAVEKGLVPYDERSRVTKNVGFVGRIIQSTTKMLEGALWQLPDLRGPVRSEYA